jgi:DNA-binding CsgD family transcriptional regulator
MDRNRNSIAVLEPSKIIYEGLLATVSKSGYDYVFYHVDNILELELLLVKKEVSVVLINPSLVLNRLNEFARLKKQSPDVIWIGIIYALFDQSFLKVFDDVFCIADEHSLIIQKINKIQNNSLVHNGEDGYLSEREIDVLKLLTKGMSNKETAEKLNISIHTVNTHRKNIMDKTGIRSLAGLTVYAVSKGVINLD